ncbi:Rv1733c family protein [Streptomyces sp. NBC_01803]|uniref:Rv1733c family protein n=1 Tax=Streptomyces sp. NBC_01803 TaxID=2975946 RepID=UPI002DDBA19D|nr:hypothetical protein [Streptomyces sp. NBC_01803]WSA47343.1 hypothetical protein OIE51_26120 [Streptomyces sp. NBC_01803]
MESTIRLWRWRRNPLRRRSDIAEAWLGLATGLVIAVGAPLAGAATTIGTAHVMLAPGADLNETAALVTGSADEAGGAGADADTVGYPAHGREVVTVDWTTPNGTTGTGSAWADADAEPGDRVTVWLDDTGGLREPPVATTTAWAAGVLLGASAAAGFCLMAVATRAGLQNRLDTRRTAAWERAWAEVAPGWSQHA